MKTNCKLDISEMCDGFSFEGEGCIVEWDSGFLNTPSGQEFYVEIKKIHADVGIFKENEKVGYETREYEFTSRSVFADQNVLMQRIDGTVAYKERHGSFNGSVIFTHETLKISQFSFFNIKSVTIRTSKGNKSKLEVSIDWEVKNENSLSR